MEDVTQTNAEESSGFFEKWKKELASLAALLVVIPAVVYAAKDAWIALKEISIYGEPLPTLKGHSTVLGFVGNEPSIAPNIFTFLEEAKSDLVLHATSLNITLHSEARREAVLDALKRGVRVHFFVMSASVDLEAEPYREFIAYLGVSKARLVESRQEIEKLRKRFLDNRGAFPRNAELNIDYYTNIPHGIWFAKDPNLEDTSVAYYVPYFYGSMSRDLTGYLIRDQALIHRQWLYLQGLQEKYQGEKVSG